MKIILIQILFICLALNSGAQNIPDQNIIQIIFTSDAHYGIKRKNFRGDTAVTGHRVNAAMIKEMNRLPDIKLPIDSGVNSGKLTGPIDYVIEGGDITNRMEIPNQSDAVSWKQFIHDYQEGITLKNHLDKRATLLVIPGNHDISNAIGFYKPMNPKRDATSMAEIYNMMLHPARPLTTASYNYSKDKINYSKNIGGIHFMFITLWPDSLERIWMEKDLKNVSSKTRVIIFTHDQPECEAKHFANPDKSRGINAADKFENLLAEGYKDAATAAADGGNTFIEQMGWVQFLKRHPNIKAYFHGNSNWNQYYVYRGPDKSVSLQTFRVDSPMKGKYSSKDETKISFQLITINTRTKNMTVRECLWNSDPSHPEAGIKWGQSETISL